MDVELQPIALHSDVRDCRSDPRCTWVSVGADAPCVSAESSLILYFEPPASFREKRSIALSVKRDTRTDDEQCAGRIRVTARNDKGYPDGLIIAKRERGRFVTFVR